MKWIALLLLFLVACSMPQPITEDTIVDVSEDEKAADTETAEPAAEPVKNQDATEKEIVVVKPAEDTEAKADTSDEADDSEVESSVPVKVSPITAAVTGPPKVEKLVLGANKVMDYLIELFAKVKSYEFRTELGKFSVRGNKFKIVLSKPVRAISTNDKGIKSQSVISTVYVDRNLKTAIGYCEGKDTGLRSECESNDLLDVPHDLYFHEYNMKLPEDWLWGLIEEKIDFVETDKYYVNSKKAIRVFFTLNSTKLDVFFDEKTGLPIRIISIKDGQSSNYDFLDLNADSVKEIDVNHRDLSDIPSEEYYY